MSEAILSTAEIAFVGAGTMGLPMVSNLHRGRAKVVAFDARPETVAAIAAEGIPVSATLAEVCTAASVVITMLPDTPDVRAVALGEGGLVSLLRPGTLVIDMSTIAAAAATEIGAALAAR